MTKPVITKSVEKDFTELEMCLDRYFKAQILPVMKQVKQDLNRMQYEETSQYMGNPSSLVMEMNDTPGLSAIRMDTVLHHSGEWNSKTAEDYLDMCRSQLQGNEHLAEDLTRLSSMWRRQVIDLIGREAYDARSQALGKDLADAYVSYRMDRQMVQFLVDEKTPKHSMEYVMRKGMGESLLGLLSNGLGQSPMESYIQQEAEKAYAPTMLEQGAGRVLGFGTDVMTTFGFGSWASVGRLAAGEVLLEGGRMLAGMGSGEEEREVPVEQYISSGVFGTRDNVLGRWQQEGRRMFADGNVTAQTLNEAMDGRLGLLPADFVGRWKVRPEYPSSVGKQEENMEVTVPFLPGYDPNHPERYSPREILTEGEQERQQVEQKEREPMTEERHDMVLDEEVAAVPQQNDGWGGMLSGMGLGDLGAIGRNMGYVISMLPDVMVGLFSGKTRSLDLKDNMLPLASILVGLFVRNPLLKTVLIGMGGLNLLNKAGHEVVEDKHLADGVLPGRKQEYRVYADQDLDPRMKNPEIQGNALFAIVDGVPSTIQLPAHTVAAWKAGALPINTLANAVLAKSDEMSRLARENYEERETLGQGMSRGI